MVKLIFIALLALLPFALGLQSDGMVSFKVTVPSACKGRTKGTCCGVGSCQIKYSLTGSFSTNEDKTPTKPMCSKVCGGHNNFCESGCNMLASKTTGQKPDSKVCKCVRPASMWWPIYKACIAKCRAASRKCITGCNDGKCPLRASSTFSFSKVVAASCKTVCKNPAGAKSIVKGVCTN